MYSLAISDTILDWTSKERIHRPLNHDGFFTNTFQMKRLARGFLRAVLPKDLLECLDLDGLSIEPTHLTDDVFKDRFADVIYRVPIVTYIQPHFHLIFLTR